MKLANDLSRDAPARSGRKRISPARFYAARSSAAIRRGLLVEEGAAEGNRILAGLARQLVDGTFDGEDIIFRSDAAPKAGRHRGGSARTYSTCRLGMSYGISTALSTASMSIPFRNIDGEPARHDRRPGDAIFPGGNLATRKLAEMTSR